MTGCSMGATFSGGAYRRSNSQAHGELSGLPEDCDKHDLNIHYLLQQLRQPHPQLVPVNQAESKGNQRAQAGQCQQPHDKPSELAVG
jgi:hypothetical protein